MNALAEAKVALAPRWRESTFMRSLGPAFHTELPPQPLPGVHWVACSEALARELGLADWLSSDEALQLLSGNATPPVGRTRASVYGGHQFGVWAGHDGRAVLRSSIREFLCSEAMHHLGVPTTRALAVTGSPQPVRRETIETAAVVTRVAPSFIRFGHFEHFAHTADDRASLQRLVDFVIDTFYPTCRDAANPTLALLDDVTRRTAELMAQWQAVGFCHGVMNNDNMSILGLTIDYGPFGFLDAFDPGHICNHSDTQGRYAYARQPQVALWNLHALAQALVPIVGTDEAALESLGDALEPYRDAFAAALHARMAAKLGLATQRDGDRELIDDFLRLMAADRTDFTITFRSLAGFDSRAGADNARVRDHFIQREAFDAWALRYATRLRAEGSSDAERGERMNRVSPKFVLRNHLAQAAIERAQRGDFDDTARLLKVLERPFDEQPEAAPYAAFPPEWAQSIEVSCSS